MTKDSNLAPTVARRNQGVSFIDVAAGTAMVRSGELKPSEWLEECLKSVRRFEAAFHAWAFLDDELARSKARALDGTKWQDWRPEPFLAGLPLGVKDVFNTKDMPTEHGSSTRSNYTPGNDARVVTQAILSGAYGMGKNETAEFAVHAPGRTVNPWDAHRITGTSSSGSAVSVLCGMTPAALGTQSAGSILRPASYIGVVGYKPTFGLIPRTGVLKTCDTLDSIGWFTRTAKDAGILLDALRVRGPDYPKVERGIAAAQRRATNWPKRRIGVCLPPSEELQQPYARDALRKFANRLASADRWEVAEVDLRNKLNDAHEVHSTIYHKSLAYYFKHELQHREQISEIFLRVTDEGKATPFDVYTRALERQQIMTEVLAEVFNKVDVLIMPTVSGEAPPVGIEEVRDSCLVWTLCGNPSISLPLFRGPNGLPFGLQMVGARYSDYSLLQVAEEIHPDSIALPDAIALANDA